MRKFLYLTLILVLIFPHLVLAATVNESFDNCDGVETLGDASNCSTGGSGFSGDWVAVSGDWNASALTCQVANCVVDSGATDANATRTFTAKASGANTVYFSLNDQNTGNAHFAVCKDGFTGSCPDEFNFDLIARRNAFADVLASDGTGTLSLGTLTYGTPQKLEFEWGTENGLSGEAACTAGQVRYSFNDATWSACRNMNAGNNPGGFDLQRDGSVLITAMFDEIAGTETAAAATAEVPTPIFIDF